MNQALLEEVKSYLNFTWEDPAKEARIEEYTNSSINYLEGIANATIDFTTDYLARDLLFNRVLYMDSHALDDFGNNYNQLLNELRIAYSVDAESEE